MREYLITEIDNTWGSFGYIIALTDEEFKTLDTIGAHLTGIYLEPWEGDEAKFKSYEAVNLVTRHKDGTFDDLEIFTSPY